MQHDKLPDEKIASSLRILAFEQDKTNQFLLEKVFAKNGYTVDVLDKAEAVLRQLSSDNERYDLFIMNVCAPIKDDLKLVGDIRSLVDHHHSTIPIVATTTAVHPDIKRRCQAAGIIDVIMKPFDIGVLLKIVRKSIQISNEDLASGSLSKPVS